MAVGVLKYHTHQQPWKSVTTVGNAVINAINTYTVVKVFTYAVFLFRFYSVVDNSWKI